MKKLLLILPRHESGYWGHVSKSGKAGMLRLSLPTVAALTPDDWSVEILDARVTPVDYDRKVDLVGITGFTAEMPSAYAIADGFRERGTPVVMGGFHVSAMPEEALNHADSVVVGEAEPVWEQLLRDFEAGALKSVYKADSLIEMKDMVNPQRELLNKKMYATGFNTIQATRGCPFDCDYCAVSAFFGRKYRRRPAGEVINEIKTFDTKSFFFVDDNIVGSGRYAKELFRALAPLNRVWGGQASINFANDEELLSLYSRSGGKYAFIGFESLSEANLRRMNKSWNSPDSYKTAIQWIQKAGISILGSFIFGLDDDDPGVFERTVKFIRQTGIDAAQFHILTPFPGTRLYDAMEAEGRIVDRDWGKYHTSDVIFKPVAMTPEELMRGYFWAFRETYKLNRTLWRSLRSMHNIMPRASLNFGYRKKAMQMPAVG
ncbi:MAG: radical SAM protein [Thermodesulfobacteriota bacterium]|nr:radical SAM protein [Thermodesulfobacteriota bacterium]